MFNFPAIGGTAPPSDATFYENEDEKRFIDNIAVIALKHFLKQESDDLTPYEMAYYSYEIARAMSKERKIK